MSPERSGAPAQVRPGSIILARHGEPALSRKVRLTAAEYRKFWADYEVLGLLPGQTPPRSLIDFVEKCGTLVASTRLRLMRPVLRAA